MDESEPRFIRRPRGTAARHLRGRAPRASARPYALGEPPNLGIDDEPTELQPAPRASRLNAGLILLLVVLLLWLVFKDR